MHTVFNLGFQGFNLGVFIYSYMHRAILIIQVIDET